MYDARIERHQAVKTAEDHGWRRTAAPNFDYFTRTTGAERSEVQVFYFDNGTVNSARIIDHGMRSSVPARRPDLLAQVLGWLTAQGG